MTDLSVSSPRRGIQANAVLISKATILIGIIICLVGIFHDIGTASITLHPEFLIARVCVAGIGSIILGLMASSWGKARVSALTFWWILTPQVMIAYMIGVTGGAASNYKYGFVFALISSTLFPILTLSQSMIIVIATFFFYVVALVVGTTNAITARNFILSSMHMITVFVMCGIARVFLDRTFTELMKYENELSEKLKIVQRQLSELAQLKALAVHQDKMVSMSHLVSAILHSINHPLNYAFMATDSALRDILIQTKPELNSSLVDVKTALTSIKTVTAGLRRFSKPKGSQVSHISTDCEVAIIVDSALQLMAEELRSVDVVKEVASNATFKCDQVAFLSVLIAILTNSAESLQRSNRMNNFIKIHAEVTGTTIAINISDNGEGIPEDIIGDIFDPFFTTDTSGKKLGLGLSIAYGEVVRHGGTLTATSHVGEGTTMHIELPVRT